MNCGFHSFFHRQDYTEKLQLHLFTHISMRCISPAPPVTALKSFSSVLRSIKKTYSNILFISCSAGSHICLTNLVSFTNASLHCTELIEQRCRHRCVYINFQQHSFRFFMHAFMKGCSSKSFRAVIFQMEIVPYDRSYTGIVHFVSSCNQLYMHITKIYEHYCRAVPPVL